MGTVSWWHFFKHFLLPGTSGEGVMVSALGLCLGKRRNEKGKYRPGTRIIYSIIAVTYSSVLYVMGLRFVCICTLAICSFFHNSWWIHYSFVGILLTEGMYLRDVLQHDCIIIHFSVFCNVGEFRTYLQQGRTSEVRVFSNVSCRNDEWSPNPFWKIVGAWKKMHQKIQNPTL